LSHILPFTINKSFTPAEDDEYITLDENTLFETFDDLIENAPNVLQQLNLRLKRKQCGQK
jgi:hypothetical protein